MDKIPYNGRDGDFQNREFTKAFDFIQQNAIGNILIRETAPTNDEMKANTFHFFNDELYLKLSNGNLYKVTLTPV